MTRNQIHWASLLTLIALGISAAGLVLISAGMGVMSLVDLFGEGANPASTMIGAAAFGFQALLVLICAWFVLQKTMRRDSADSSARFPFSEWQFIPAFGLIFFALPIGAVIAYAEISWLSTLTLPFLTLLIILPPIWVLLGIGTRGIDLGLRWRAFGVFGLGMTLSPLVMVMLEVVVLILILIVAFIWIAMQPNVLNEVINLVDLIKNETSENAILQLLAPYILKPGVIATVLFFISVIVPLIEELFKPLAVWFFARSLESPAQGFVLGLFSGAAFALMESLNASADGSASWGIIVMVRAGTSLLHITASGLVGWGIASAFREKKIWRLIGAYFSAVTIHGIWNACAIAAGVSAIAGGVGKPEWLFTIAPAALCGMVILGVGMLVILIASNRKLRTPKESRSISIT